MDNHRIKFLSTSRGQVEYLDTGKGEAVLSLHGAMGGYDQADVLARTVGPPGCRYLALSRPGYLGTPLCAGVSPEEQADLYAEFLDLLNIRTVVVMAISGGGPSAIHFALRHRDRCWGLILISTMGGPADNKLPLFFYVLAFLARFPAFVTMLKKKAEKNLIQVMRRSITDPAIREQMLKDPEATALYRELALGGFDRLRERIAGTKNDVKTAQTKTYPLRDIAIPILVVHGTKDPLVPLAEHGQRLTAEIPGAKLLTLAGGEHAAIFTHRREVQEGIASFLALLEWCCRKV